MRGVFGFSGGLFRLADDNQASSSGYFEQIVNTAAFHVDYRPLPAVVLSLGAKYTLYTQWEVMDDDGDSIQTFELDNTPGVELRITYTF